MVRVGLVGAGFMGKMHANVYSVLEDATLVAVADTASGVAAEVAGQWGAKAYESFEAMMAAEKLDLVDICLPIFMPARMASSRILSN
jgi:predicted dehydrogenase